MFIVQNAITGKGNSTDIHPNFWFLLCVLLSALYTLRLKKSLEPVQNSILGNPKHENRTIQGKSKASDLTS